MAEHLRTSIGVSKLQLRDRIIRTYRRAQRIVVLGSESPPAKTHAMTIAYDKACEHLRSDIAHASRLFPNTEALLVWLLEGLTDEIISEHDRIELALAIRTLSEEVAEGRKAS